MVELKKSTIQTFNIPEPKFPTWSKGRVLIGAKGPLTIDLNRIVADAYFHEYQTGNQIYPTGHEILASLVKSYRVEKDWAGKDLPSRSRRWHQWLLRLERAHLARTEPEDAS
jgi:hypothetical protein